MASLLSLLGLGAWRDRNRALRDMRAMQRLDESLLDLDINNPVRGAKVALEAGDRHGAEEFWIQARDRYPEYVLRSKDVIEILLRLHRFDEAEKLMALGKRRFPKDPHYAEAYAQIPQQTGDIPEAIRRWEAVRKKFPFRGLGYAAGADCLSKLNRLAEAEKLLQRAVSRIPSDVRIWMAYAKSAEELGKWEDALPRWEVVKTRLRHFSGVMGIARCLQRLGRTPEAEESLKAARLTFPLEADIVNQLARLAEERGDNEQAVQWWQVGRQRFPRSQTAYIEGTKLLKKMQRFADADAALLVAVDQFPQDSWPLFEYAMVAHGQQDWPEAAKRWAGLREAFPDRIEGYAEGAIALSGCGREEEAAEMRAERIKRFP